MEYKDFAIDIAYKAGEIMRQNFQLGMKKEWKSDNSPVTETDMAINNLVIEEINKNFPDHNINAEEKSDNNRISDYLWVCDPIDGTMPFTNGIPIFTFSLALVKNGEPILGVIYDPILNRLFFAEKNQGAFLNNQPIKVSEKQTLEKSTIDIVNFDNASWQIWELAEWLSKKWAIVYKLNCITYPSALVACGEFDATIFPHHTAHDIAAVKIIVEEAGGKVTDLFGNKQRYDKPIKGAIVSNDKIHGLLLEEISKIIHK